MCVPLITTYWRISGSHERRRSYRATATSSESLTKDVKCIQDGSYVPDNCTDILSLTAAQDT